MGLERGAVVEKLDGAWSARYSFRPGAWSGDQGTIDWSVERRCKNRAERSRVAENQRACEPTLERRTSILNEIFFMQGHKLK